MRIEDIHYVLAVVEEANLTRASERMNISGSAMSEAIKRVEVAVGMTVFDRSNRGMILTADGELLVPHFEAVADAANALHRVRAGGAGGSNSRPLRVGTVFGYGTTILQRLLDDPPVLPNGWKLTIQVGVTDWRDPSGGLSDGLADLAVVPGPLEIDDQLIRVALCEIPRVVLFTANHPFSRKSALTLAQVDEIGWISTEEQPADPTWASFMLAERQRGGPPPSSNYAPVQNPQEAVLAIHNGHGALVAIPELVELFSFGDIVTKPVVDLPPVPIDACFRAGTACSAISAVIQALQAGLPPTNSERAIMGLPHSSTGS